jgi:hypothetical protein
MIFGGLPTPVTTLNEVTIAFAPESKIETYQYNMLQGQSDCTSSVYGAQLPIATPIKSNLGVPGLNTLCVKGQDSTGKSTGVFSYSWIFDIIRKELVLGGLPESEDPAEKLAIGVSGVNIKEYKYAVIHEDGAQCGNVKYSGFRPIDVAIDDKLSLGGYTLCIIAKNGNGEIATPSRYAWARIKMPEVSIEATSGLPPAITNQASFIGIKVSGLNAESYKSGFKIGDVDCAGVLLSTPNPVATPFDLDLGATPVDGSYTICLSGIGHFKQASPLKKYLFAFDKTPPLFQLVNAPSGLVATNVISITVTSDTAVQYVFVRKLGVKTCNNAPESTGKFPIATLLTDIANEGDQTLCVWTFDNANNPSPPRTVTWKVDSIAPVQNEITQDVVNAGSIDIRVTIANLESAGASYKLYSQTAADAAILPCDPATAATYNQGPFNITQKRRFNRPAAGEKTRVCVFVQDPAGNKSNVQFTDVIPDAAP